VLSDVGVDGFTQSTLLLEEEARCAAGSRSSSTTLAKGSSANARLLTPAAVKRGSSREAERNPRRGALGGARVVEVSGRDLAPDLPTPTVVKRRRPQSRWAGETAAPRPPGLGKCPAARPRRPTVPSRFVGA